MEEMNTENNQSDPQPTRRSIRDIKKDSTGSNGVTTNSNKVKPNFSDEKKFAGRRYRSNRRSRSTFIFGGIGVLIILFFIISSVAHNADIVITPEMKTISFSDTLTAGLNDEGSDITYSLQKFSFQDEVTVEATGTENVSEKASGTITVYNEASEDEQLFVANTRFESPDGRVFRTDAALAIPGGNKDNPGIVEDVRVFADEVGDSFNGSIDGRFSVPGLASDDDLFSGIYAESTSSFAGGFEGERPVASTDDEDAGYETLESNLNTNLTESIVSEIPSGFIQLALMDDPVFSKLPSKGESGEVVLSGEISVDVAIVSEADLATFLLIESGDSKFDSSQLTILSKDNLGVEVETSEEGDLLVSFTKSVDIRWKVDEERAIDDVAGLSLSDLDDYVDDNRSISGAEVDLSPFWRRSLPSNPEKIDLSLSISEKSE